MADETKISELPSGVINGTTIFPGVTGGVTEQFTSAQLTSYVGGMNWAVATLPSQQMTTNTGYISNSSVLQTFTLPATMAVGDKVAIAGQGSGGWGVVLNTGQKITIGNTSTTVSTGSIASTNKNDSIELICTVSNTTLVALCAPQGQIDFDTI